MEHLCEGGSASLSKHKVNIYETMHITGLEISQNKICGGECDSCKF